MRVIFAYIFACYVSSAEIDTGTRVEAFFQGRCTLESPCRQTCIDLPTGGYECDCWDGYKLHSNGFSCIGVIITSDTQKGDSYETGEEELANTKNLNTKLAENLTKADTSLVMTNAMLGDEPAIKRKVETDSKDRGLHHTIKKRKLRKNDRSQRRKLKNKSLRRKAFGRSRLKITHRPFVDSMDSLNSKDIYPEQSEEQTNQLFETTSVFQKFNSCEDFRCHAGGQCIPDLMRGGVRCQCPLGNDGDFCETDLIVRYPKFMGSGYIAFPVLRGAYKEFNIMIDFRPDTENGLMLFSSEHPNARADFFSITLIDGYAEFRFDCGTGMAKITTSNKVELGNWNTIRVHRNDWNGWIQLNDGQQARGRSKDLYSRITFRQDLYLGGYKNLSTIGLRTGMQWGYVGCVRYLEINGKVYDMRKGAFVGDAIHGIDVGECSAHLCDSVKCQNGGSCVADSADSHVCLCPLGTAGDRCENRIDIHVPSFSGTSYLQYIGLRRTVLSFTEIEIVFKADDRNGLLLYNGYTSDRSGDFISLGLVNGYLEYRFDLGTGPAIIRSRQPISLHQWHVVRASRTGRDGYMQIDNQAAVEGLAKGAYTQLTLTLDLFIGGHRNFDEVAKNAQQSQAFKGCIQKVIINERPMRMVEEAINGVNVDNCEHPCGGQPCLNGGRCIPIRDTYKCSCPLGFENSNCEDPIREPILVPMFSGDGFLLFTDPDIIQRIRGNKVDIQMQLRASASNGVLLWVGEDEMTSSSDYLSIGLRNGYVHFGFNLGSGEVVMSYRTQRIDDGLWHKIRVHRYDRLGYLEVDGTEVVEGMSPAPLKQLNIKPRLYIGGMEEVLHQTFKKYTTGFNGCVTNVTLATDYHIDLMAEAAEGRNIVKCASEV